MVMVTRSEIYGNFSSIYKEIGVTSPEEFQRTASQWILDFLSIPMQGHSKANVTPYMHMLAVHVSEQIDLYGDIRRFTGQGQYNYIH
jgi:hypothetical protein